MPEPEEKLEQLVKAYKAVFGGDNGKLILENLKDEGFFYRSTWGGNAESTLINEGMRCLVLHIVTMVTFDFEDIKKMIEAKSTEEED